MSLKSRPSCGSSVKLAVLFPINPRLFIYTMTSGDCMKRLKDKNDSLKTEIRII